MKRIFERIAAADPMRQLDALLQAASRKVSVTGLTESLGCLMAAALLEQLQRPVLLITGGPRRAEQALDDLVSVLGTPRVGFLPPLKQHPFDTTPLASGPRNERTEALLRLGSGSPTILVTQPEAILEPGPDLDWIRAHTCRIVAGQNAPRDRLLGQLIQANYTRESLVDSQGQFAVRGGLVDVFPYGHEHPVRMEFDGDLIASLRHFDPVTQRSVAAVPEFVFLCAEDGHGDRGGILEALPDGAAVVWLGMDDITQRLERFLDSEGGGALPAAPTRSEKASQFEIPDLPETLHQVIWAGPIAAPDAQVTFGGKRPDPFPPGVGDLASHLRRYLNRGLEVWLTADAEGERERLDEQLAESGLDGILTSIPSLSEGFISPAVGIAVLTSHELFNRRRMRARHTRFRRRAVQFDRSSLIRGDLVVHTEYGIGIFEGLQNVKVRGQQTECLRIRYAEDVILYVNVEQFSQVEKYVGSESAKPPLSRIGTRDWVRTKQRTSKSLEDMSVELIRLYAQRKVVPGHPFPLDTHWQREMEASFEFEDTPDQVVATAEIKLDLEDPHPMDRLLCGDVGFGKTEVAIRAAFKVVQESHQVAVLVPTTILAQQHLETFSNRLAQYPVKIEVLSRFRTPPEQKAVVKALKEGKVDIVIGTHRLLSKDVEFQRLGLVIVDEEHRFGVRHKERLKQIKGDVDVLTLTATPIPRTLQLALSGARDTSQINTPPVDRLPVQTEIHSWSEELIRDAILREVDRQGQVFFVHNRVQSIQAIQGMLERLVPGLRYTIAHGQMPERQLERVVVDFYHQRYDVLVTTMIIESGLDMPNVNTLIVNRADRFGLAQLYQLRGRIGRSNRQAYAYLLTPPRLAMSSVARQRLGTLAELTELGSGMKVALRDLEIRGAGNLLGAQQSGFINAIGFDLYTHLLEEAVARIKGEEPPAREAEEVRIEFDGDALLPPEYIDDGDLRYYFYRRMASAIRMEELEQLAGELEDRFGALPPPARNLLEVARLKILCRVVGFSRITVGERMLSADLKLPPEAEAGQKIIGRLVAAADPEQIEFRMQEVVELTCRFNSPDPLKACRKFLQRLERYGILLC